MGNGYECIPRILPMKTVLVPIDFSAATDPVIAESIALARAANARLVALHVVQPPVFVDSDLGAGLSAEYTRLAEAAADRELARLQRQQLAKGITIETRHRVGLPGQAILDEAEKLGANYIVLGSHGHSAFYDLIVGGTTSRVLKRADCPVVVVPPQAKKARKVPAPAGSL